MFSTGDNIIFDMESRKNAAERELGATRLSRWRMVQMADRAPETLASATRVARRSDDHGMPGYSSPALSSQPADVA